MRNTSSVDDERLTHLVDAARPLKGVADDYDALLDLIGDAHYVLIGEASHGTHEFYRERARLTQRLIEERHFNAVDVEERRCAPVRHLGPWLQRGVHGPAGWVLRTRPVQFVHVHRGGAWLSG